MSPEFLEAEKASRVRTSLITESTNPDGYYDQVVAMSQGMMNVALAKIHENNEEMNAFDGSSLLGSINADLDPSQIVIPEDADLSRNNAIVIWQWRFKSGFLTVKVNDFKAKVPVDGWVIAVKVPLDCVTMAHDATDSETEANTKAEGREWFKNNFSVPGDYRPERLYAKMGDAHWQSFSFAESSFSFCGTKYDYEDWKKLGSNGLIAQALKNILEQTSIERSKLGLTTIGSRFNFDGATARPTELVARFPPVAMIHQGYPYKIPSGFKLPETSKEQEKEKDSKKWKDLDVYKDPGSRNCLLYCELIANHTHDMKALSYSGNFTTVGNGVGNGRRVDGTFALSRQLFFDKFLLKHLQVFVLESQIYPEHPNFSESSEGNINVNWNYRCGCNPPQDPNKDAFNSIYNFHFQASQGNTPPHYRAHVDVITDHGLHKTDDPLTYTKFYSSGSPTVFVRWTPGTNVIEVQGETEYWWRITTANHQNVDAGTHGLSQAESKWYDIYRAKWSFSIEVNAKAGSLVMELHKPDSVVHVEKGKGEYRLWKPNNNTQPERIRSEIERSIGKQLQHFEEVLSNGFNDQMNLIYPGNGQLDFRNTMFNFNGDILSEIRYKDIDGMVVIPPVKSLGPPPQTESPSIHGGGSSGPLSSRLAWTSESPVLASQKPSAGQKPPAENRVTLRITGTNKNADYIYLDNVKAEYSSAMRGVELFSVLDFVVGPGGTQEQVEFTVEVTPPSSVAVAPAILEPMKLTERAYDCNVTLRAQKGPIAVPPGGSISLVARGVSGKAGVSREVRIIETWCDKHGNLPAGLPQFISEVAFKLN